MAIIASNYPDNKPYVKEVANTVELLKRIFNGTTSHKEKEASNLRRQLQKEILDFQQNLRTYYDDLADDGIKRMAFQSIKNSLKIQAPFTAFKYWIIKENEALNKVFGNFLPT